MTRGKLLDPANNGDDGILVIGQSNAVGYGNGYDALLDPTHGRIWQFAGAGTYLGQRVLGVDPLIAHEQQGSNRIGHAMTFAREYTRIVPENRTVCLIPAAHGTTGFTTTGALTNGCWDPAGGYAAVNLYEYAIAQALGFLALSPKNRLICVLWLQGESDASLTQSQYATFLLALIDGLRTRLGNATLPFLIGQMTGYARSTVSGLPGINLAHIDIPRQRVRTAFYYGPDDLADTSYGNGPPRDLHYSAKGQRVVGVQAFNALPLARANVLGAAPVAPSGVTLVQSGTTVNVSWTRMIQRVTDYLVETNTGSGWSTLSRTSPNIDNTAQVTGLTLGATLQVRVSAINEQGTSAPSGVASLTLVKLPNVVTSLTHGTNTATTVPLTWAAPAVDGTHDAATSYLVEYKLHSAGSYTTFGTVTALAATVTGLAVNSSYDFRVTAQNAAGAATGVVHTTSTTVLAALLTDVTATALRAYGVRKLRAAYAGSAIRVRRASDNTESDIGFDPSGSGDLDTATLATFCAGTDGFVKTLYDQSGSGWDLTQATAGNQAKIVTAGTVITKNGKASILFDGTATFYTDNHTGLYSAGAATALRVAQDGVLSGTHYLATEAGATANPLYGLVAETSGAVAGFTQSVFETDAAVIVNAAGNITTSDQLHQIVQLDTGSALTHTVDGVTTTSVNGFAYTRGTTTLTKFILGAKTTTPTSVWSGNLSEIVLFASALSGTDQTNGRTNQKNYYNTP